MLDHGRTLRADGGHVPGLRRDRQLGPQRGQPEPRLHGRLTRERTGLRKKGASDVSVGRVRGFGVWLVVGLPTFRHCAALRAGPRTAACLRRRSSRPPSGRPLRVLWSVRGVASAPDVGFCAGNSRSKAPPAGRLREATGCWSACCLVCGEVMVAVAGWVVLLAWHPWLVRSHGVRPMRLRASLRWAAICLVAWAILSHPVSLSRLMASERRLAMMRGVWPVRTWEASSA